MLRTGRGNREEVMSEIDEHHYGVSRLVASSDGVFAFAITLLITTIPYSLRGLPPSASNEQVVQHLLSLLPNFYAYVFSFYMIGIYWVAHHQTFRHIIKYDSLFLWINLTLLLFIVFLPVPTSFLGRYGANAVITAFYGATQALINLIYMIMEWYAFSYHRLIVPSLDQKTIKYTHSRSLIAFFIFTLSIGIAFLNPILAKLLWIAILVVQLRPIVLIRSRWERS
jgi:uncharacterized membrane protein